MELGKWLRLAWDRAAALALIGVGALALLLGWIGVSGEAFPAKQLPYIISGGITGIFVLGVGALFWLSADMRDEWTKLDRIEDALNRLADSGLVNREALQQADAPEPRAVDLVEPAAAAGARVSRQARAGRGRVVAEP